MEKLPPTKYSVSVIVRSGHRPDEFLIVRRPSDDSDLPGVWGLPATTMRDDESPEEAARRACQEKLGCSAEPIRFVGAMHQVRDAYNLLLMDIEVILTGSAQPDVSQATTRSTKYIDQCWTPRPEDLQPAADAGSCCASIFLTDQKMLKRTDWRLQLGTAV
jgi:8-oxo-dGTP pyrophosphatase MutT (NUDIX family)